MNAVALTLTYGNHLELCEIHSDISLAGFFFFSKAIPKDCTAEAKTVSKIVCVR